MSSANPGERLSAKADQESAGRQWFYVLVTYTTLAVLTSPVWVLLWWFRDWLGAVWTLAPILLLLWIVVLLSRCLRQLHATRARIDQYLHDRSVVRQFLND